MHAGNLHSTTKLYLSTVFLTGAVCAAATPPDMHLTGLALHQETGRNIYLGGIFLDQHVPQPDQLVTVSGPRLMEYRVVARRTSIRSLLGSILLQSELASGKVPDTAVTNFANDILSSVKGSLYDGDTLGIMRNENDQTIAYLNDHELARVDDNTVADYILAGWTGEQGPATAFRQSILAKEIDPALLAIFESSVYSATRAEEVASWLQPGRQLSPVDTVAGATRMPAGDELAEVPTGSAEFTVAVSAYNTGELAANQDRGRVDASAEAIESPATMPLEPLIRQPGARAIRNDDHQAPVPAAQEDAQVASLMPAVDPFNSPMAVDALQIKDYSTRLARFNTALIKRVYGEIRYPTRAIRRNIQGRLELDVTLAKDGELVDVAVAQSSGYRILDKAAVAAAVKALSTIDPADLDLVAIAEYGGNNDELVIPIPVQFRLTD